MFVGINKKHVNNNCDIFFISKKEKQVNMKLIWFIEDTVRNWNVEHWHQLWYDPVSF